MKWRCCHLAVRNNFIFISIIFFKTKDEHKVEHKTIFKTHGHVFTCGISYGRGIQTQKPKRLSPTPYILYILLLYILLVAVFHVFLFLSFIFILPWKLDL